MALAFLLCDPEDQDRSGSEDPDYTTLLCIFDEILDFSIILLLAITFYHGKIRHVKLITFSIP